MSSVQHTSDFVLNIIHPLIRSFLEKTTAEQWESFVSGSADDATKILVAELILEIIAALSGSVVTSLRLRRAKSEEHLMSELEESLPQTLSEALGIPDEVDHLRLKTLTGIIHEEVKFSLFSGGRAGLTRHLTPVAVVNSMTEQLIHLFQKFSEKIKTFVVPRPCKSPDGSPKEAAPSQVMDSELRDIIQPLLEDIPDSEELQQELSGEIQKVADEVVCTFCGMRSKKLSAFRATRKRMKSFVTKSFAKVCLMRILAHLERQHSQESAAVGESAETILSSLASQFAEPRPQSRDAEDSFLLMFKHLRGDKVQAFGRELSRLLSRHAASRLPPRPAPKASFGAEQQQSKVQAEVWRKTWVFMVLMNWFLTTQVHSVVRRVTLPLMHRSGSGSICFSASSPAGFREADSQRQDSEKNKKYVKFVIEKVVFTVCSDANMVPETRDQLIGSLTEAAWSSVQEEQFYIHPEVFRNIEKEIRKSLYQSLSSPENVLFLITHEDPLVVDRIMSLIHHKLFTPHREENPLGRMLSSLGSAVSRIFTRWSP